MDASSSAADSRSTTERACAWMPVVSSRPVLPTEDSSFCALRPHVCEALQLCWEQHLPIVALPMQQGLGDGHDDGETEVVGTTLELQALETLPHEAGTVLRVKARGLQRVRVLERSVQPLRSATAILVSPGEQAASEQQSKGVTLQVGASSTLAAGGLINMAYVELLPDLYDLPPALPSMPDHSRATASSSSTLPREQGAAHAYRAHILKLLAAVRAPALNSDVDTVTEDAEAFSWLVAAQLPLPAATRGLLLRVRDPKERLAICVKVLEPLAAVSSLPGPGAGSLRARL
eukprot:TRINITY_DN33894_c0_g1_i1.p1 TRINITY_DN33894_c0_g1~~TRINITY_DN33894_c0_g1_i1.p1  ORF type:complete len:290 (-),score=47.28 TRINITY_DN33894_c0_g1_i1:354-1223(-)